MASDEDRRRSAAAQLELGARGLGAGAAEKLLERDDGAGSFAVWHGFYAERVLELSVGVALDEPALAAGGFSWSAAALTARGARALDASVVVGAMRDSLREDLAEDEWAVVSSVLDRLGEAATDAPPTGIPRLKPDDDMKTEALRFLERTLAGEGRAAVDALLAMQRHGTPTRELFERVLMPAAAEMGTMWHLGEISVSEEHAATETVHAAISVLWHSATRDGDAGASVVVGAVSEDRHDIGVRATAALLELAGCRVASLGADLPAGDFVQAVRDYEAEAVVIGATLVTHLPRVVETIAALRAEKPGLRIVVGGPALAMAEGLAAKVGADALARSPGEAIGHVVC